MLETDPSKSSMGKGGPMRLFFLVPVIFFFLSGCIVVQSDAARVDPETGAIRLSWAASPATDEAADEFEEELHDKDDNEHDDDANEHDDDANDHDDDDNEHDDDGNEHDDDGNDDDDDGNDDDDDDDDNGIAAQRDEVEQLERQLHEAEVKMEISEFQWHLAEDEAEHQRESEHRALDEANRDLHLFHEFGEAKKTHGAHQSLAYAENRLQDAEAELEQLSTLYEGSELEDGTAELILSRGARQLDQARKSLEQARRDHHVSLAIEIPKQRESLERAVSDAERAMERGDIERQIAEMEHELGSQQQHRDLDKLREKLEEARHDLRDMTGEVVEPRSLVWRLF
jgi:hypothetical protein